MGGPPYTSPESRSFESENYSGFLTPSQREFLLGRKTDISNSYRDKLKSDIRKRVQGAQRDFALINQHLSSEEKEKIPRESLTQSNPTVESNMKVSEQARTDALESANAIGSTFHTQGASAAMGNFESLVEIMEQSDRQRLDTVPEFLGHVIAQFCEQTDVEFDEITEAIETRTE